jgi:hypothetical protein
MRQELDSDREIETQQDLGRERGFRRGMGRRRDFQPEVDPNIDN